MVTTLIHDEEFPPALADMYHILFYAFYAVFCTL